MQLQVILIYYPSKHVKIKVTQNFSSNITIRHCIKTFIGINVQLQAYSSLICAL